jgi:hypothetical protein
MKMVKGTKENKKYTKQGNLIVVNFNYQPERIDPATVLDEVALEVFYEGIEEISKYSNITNEEWNFLIELVQKADQVYSAKYEKAADVIELQRA